MVIKTHYSRAIELLVNILIIVVALLIASNLVLQSISKDALQSSSRRVRPLRSARRYGFQITRGTAMGERSSLFSTPPAVTAPRACPSIAKLRNAFEERI